MNININLFVLVDQILEDQDTPPLSRITERQFRGIIHEIYNRINVMGRWTSTKAWGDHQKDDQELMRRYGNDTSLHPYSVLTSFYIDEPVYSTIFLAQKESLW